MSAYKAACSKVHSRSYSIPYEDKVAKFKGKKGSDVCGTPILDGPTQPVLETKILERTAH